MRMPKLLQKVLAGVLVLFVAVVVTTSVISGWNLDRLLREQYDSKGAALANDIAAASVETLLNRDASTLQSALDQSAEIQGVSYVFIVDDRGQIVAHTFVPSVPEAVRSLSGNRATTTIRDVHVDGLGDFADIAAPILGGEAGYVHVGMDRAIMANQIKSAIAGTSLAILVVMIALAAAGAMVVIRTVTRPILRLTDVAQSLERGDPYRPEALAGLSKQKDELGQLARVFGDMAAQVKARETRLKQQVEELRIEIDQTKKAKQVAEITESDYFKSLRQKAKEMRTVRE
ncbi:MAG: HAMP domain-containing protein [Chloroflexi bacterium]|nr:HAMP domain-containing protein [Chloroflexota bacterium]